MSEHHAEIVIIKRKGAHAAGHHGGAWKIAFADFMTAMMAFFLVLWIINATDKDTKAVIARYFNPTKLENPARARKGVHGVDSNKVVSNESSGDQMPGIQPSPAPENKNEKASGPSAPPSVGEPPKKDQKPKSAAAVPHPEARNAVDVMPTMSETALFSDPYKALDKIEGGRSTNDATAPGPDTGEGEPSRQSGQSSIEAFRDPFKPIGESAPNIPVSMDVDASPAASPEQHADLLPQMAAPPHPEKPPETPGIKPAPATSPVAGTPALPQKSDPSNKAADLVNDLRERLALPVTNSSGPEISVAATKEGLLVSLTDKLNFSMFAVGSAEPRAEVIKAMNAIAGLLKSHPGVLIVRGHTDARPYRNGTYDNWRLSSDRAQMAYYMLTRAGVPESRFERIEGHADHSLRDSAHPDAAENRRIEILVRENKS